MTVADYFKNPEGGLSSLLFHDTVARALQEDLGRSGDLTTDSIFAPDHRSAAVLRARDEGVLAGLAPALYAFHLLDQTLEIELFAHDGASLAPGSLIARLSGSTRTLLTGERTALNILCHLSGIATKTHRLVAQVLGTRAQIVDTRKTLPGLRALQKYAVRVGGGRNHRFGLDDCVLIKDNHIAACGSLEAAVDRVRSRLGHTVKVEIEVDTLEQFKRALELEVDIIMLDNMDAPTLRNAVELNQGNKVLETSGRVSEQTVQALAQTGVDLISVGALTHSVANFDIGLDYE